MPAYTLGEIMSQATWRAGRRVGLEPSTVSFLANEAYLEVAGIWPRAASERTAHLSISSGEQVLALPEGCEELVHLSYVGSADPLVQIEIEELDSRDTGAGKPSAFAFYGASSLVLWPSPSSDWSAQLRYREQISDMTELSSVPSLATPWRAAIIPKLEEKLHIALGNGLGAAMAQQRYLGLVSQLKSDEARRQSTRHEHGVRVLYNAPAGTSSSCSDDW
jgi:hypothetical protein